MAKPFSMFPATMQKRAAQVGKNSQRMVVRVGKHIGHNLVDETPVDEGTARSNWRASVNAPATGVIPPYAPGRNLGRGEAANAKAAKAQISSSINSYRTGRDRAIFIVNRVPYIGLLNDGSSRQTASNFVERSVQRGAQLVKTSKLLED